MWAHIVAGEWVATYSDDHFFTPLDGSLGPTLVRFLSAEQKATFGLVEVVEDGGPDNPAYYVSSFTDEVIAGVPTRTWINTPRPMSELKPAFLNMVEVQRVQRAAAGVTADGILFLTDNVTLGVLAAHFVAVRNELTSSVVWPFVAGPINIHEDDFEIYFGQIMEYVAAVGARAMVLADAVTDATSLSMLLAIPLNDGWPSTELAGVP